MNIIVIGSGNHHNTLGVIRALGESGYGVDLITYGSSRKNYVAHSKYVNTHHSLKSIDDLSSFLMARKQTTDKEVIISCADGVTEQLNNHKCSLESRYTFPGIPEEGKMVKLMDKTTMIQMAADRGVKAPQVWMLPEDREKVTFPCMTKVHISSHGAKTDIIICYTEDQLNEFLRDNTDDIFAQAYIKKKEEVQFIGCSLDDGEKIIIPGMSKVLRSQPNTNTGFLEYGPIDPFYKETVENAKKYIRDCQYSGLFSFEIMRGWDDQIWFLEINFRNDGNAWCTTKAGINLPVIWVKACLGVDYSDEICEPQRIIMMPEFQDLKLVIQRKISLCQWMKDWKRTDYFMEYDKNDPGPFWHYILDKFK